jgi:16S rRNA processing protein RimM
MIAMGRVLAPWGLKGAVKVEPWGAERDSLCKFSTWWVGKAGKLREIAVAECKVQGVYLVARFEGCDDPDKADAYRGAEIALKREALPKPAEHEFYQVDLIGLAVMNMQGERLGKVAGFISTGAHEVMRVEHERGERLVPATAEVIRKVDLDAGTVEVDWGADW